MVEDQRERQRLRMTRPRLSGRHQQKRDTRVWATMADAFFSGWREAALLSFDVV